jgi:rhamnosyltransferase
MSTNRICAVVVTFHPDEDVLENLYKLRDQVDGLVVVDNGSSPQSIALLRRASSEIQFELIENGENLGIATALNIGIRWVERNDYHWVILFDQDSAVTDGFIATMIHAYETHPQSDRLGILVPRYVDKRSGNRIPAPLTRKGEIEIATTSGSLMLVSSFLAHGLFVDDLFIDSVDYEYSLRLRSDGYLLEECQEAVLLHSPGTPKIHRFFGIYLFQTSNYSPIRRYYQERNKIWVARKYWRKCPDSCLKLFSFSLNALVKIILAENQKWDKCYSFSMGIVDGFRGRMGRTNRF